MTPESEAMWRTLASLSLENRELAVAQRFISVHVYVYMRVFVCK